MRLKLKSIKGVEYSVEVESLSLTVKEIKRIIEDELKFEVSCIKLLFNGIILDDKSSIENYKIKEDSVLILMTTKIKKKNEDLANKLDNPEVVSKKNDLEPENEKFKSQIQQLVDMGFEISESKIAIESANGSVQIAIDELSKAVKVKTSETKNSKLVASNNPEAQNRVDEALGYNLLNTEVLDNFNLSDPNALTNISCVLRMLISSNPLMLQELLEEVGETNPEIIDFISEHEQQFKQLMSQPVTDQDAELFNRIMGVKPGEEGIYMQEGEEEEEEDDEELAAQLDLDSTEFNQKDREAIQNLVSLGFNESDATQAYIVCDKNEESAANFLLQEHNFK